MAEYEGVTPESPAGTDLLDGASSAGTLTTGQPAPPPTEATIPYARFKEVNEYGRDAAARAAAAEQAVQMHQQQAQQLQQRLQALEGQLQQRVNEPSRTPQEEQERRAALTALKSLQSADPDYVKIQRAAQALPAVAQALLQSQERQTQLEQRFALSFARGEEGRLYQLATQAGLSFQSAEHCAALNDYVAGIIRADPQAWAAFRAGDPTILPAAFQIARAQHDATARAPRAGLAQTKAATQRLPPRIGGGTPGAAPPPKYDPADHRGSMAKINAAAEAALQAALG